MPTFHGWPSLHTQWAMRDDAVGRMLAEGPFRHDVLQTPRADLDAMLVAGLQERRQAGLQLAGGAGERAFRESAPCGLRCTARCPRLPPTWALVSWRGLHDDGRIHRPGRYRRFAARRPSRDVSTSVTDLIVAAPSRGCWLLSASS